jgi:hypothetical protein
MFASKVRAYQSEATFRGLALSLAPRLTHKHYYTRLERPARVKHNIREKFYNIVPWGRIHNTSFSS